MVVSRPVAPRRRRNNRSAGPLHRVCRTPVGQSSPIYRGTRQRAYSRPLCRSYHRLLRGVKHIPFARRSARRSATGSADDWIRTAGDNRVLGDSRRSACRGRLLRGSGFRGKFPRVSEPAPCGFDRDRFLAFGLDWNYGQLTRTVGDKKRGGNRTAETAGD